MPSYMAMNSKVLLIAAACNAVLAFAPPLPTTIRARIGPFALRPPVRRSVERVRRVEAVMCSMGERVEECGEGVAGATRTKVKCIFSDVDGTLLDKQHCLAPETRKAILDAIAAGIPFVMATGKSRGPWVQEIRHELGFTSNGYSLNGPGVFIQGLLVCDENGRAVQQLTLMPPVIEEMNQFAALRAISLVAYTTDDRIVCAKTDEHTDKIIPFNEPVPEGISDAGMTRLALPSHPDVYKMMLMGEESILARTRPDLEKMLLGKATVTKAMDEMLEILPLGASKWTGVAKALEMLGYAPGDCLAIGDGENDLEMLQQVGKDGGVAVAVGNAVPRLKDAATEVMSKTHDAGAAAEAIRRFALGLPE